MTGPSVAASYGYNGLGDRLQEIANGQTTSFHMDYNPSTSLRAGSGLTQVLNDGTNNYIYGNGRIAQVNTSMEYFLGDALGSVRQLTNTSGAVTYASAYDPYGVTTQSYGSSQSAYGYTGEFTSNVMVYLRARHYVPGMGRFLTRDTWKGNANRPLSLNRWMYVEGNPINLTDPTGHMPPPPINRNVCRATFPVGGKESRINIAYADKNVKLSKSDWLNTYVAAGIAVQCWADIYPLWDENTSGRGIAQISRLQQEKPYGKTIKVGDGENGFGLRCYIPILREDDYSGYNPCPICFTKDDIKRINKEHRDSGYFSKNYELEPIVYLNEQTSNHTDVALGIMYMKRKIQAVINSCRGDCTVNDIFIAAGLGQGSGFTPDDMSTASNPRPESYVKSGGTDTTKLYVIPLDNRGVIIDWQKYFNSRDHPRATAWEIARFVTAVQGLNQKGWALPSDPINWTYISSFK